MDIIDFNISIFSYNVYWKIMINVFNNTLIKNLDLNTNFNKLLMLKIILIHLYIVFKNLNLLLILLIYLKNHFIIII
jgi:hypothetical protein